tara:strand:+ start:3078 stop:3935 length:858 start_codon:yes stop_codon:yes gene_type:complete
MTKILVLGVTGMIGHKVYQVFSEETPFHILGLSRRPLDSETIIKDLRDFNSLEKALKKIKPEYIINCSGLLIEHSEKSPIDAVKLNALLPLFLKELSSELKFRIVQISTDCVFSGKGGPYKEYSETDATNIYGKTKAISEIKDDKNLTIRTSVIGPDLYEDGLELFHWFMNQSDEVSGFTKSFWSGVTTLELARSIVWSIENDITGLRNLTTNNPISKYQLLTFINQITKMNLKIKKTDGPSHNKGLINTSNFFYEAEVAYEEIIKNMIQDIVSRKSHYPHYKID